MAVEGKDTDRQIWNFVRLPRQPFFRRNILIGRRAVLETDVSKIGTLLFHL